MKSGHRKRNGRKLGWERYDIYGRSKPLCSTYTNARIVHIGNEKTRVGARSCRHANVEVERQLTTRYDRARTEWWEPYQAGASSRNDLRNLGAQLEGITCCSTTCASGHVRDAWRNI